jgi:hypothetical protein
MAMLNNQRVDSPQEMAGDLCHLWWQEDGRPPEVVPLEDGAVNILYTLCLCIYTVFIYIYMYIYDHNMYIHM